MKGFLLALLLFSSAVVADEQNFQAADVFDLEYAAEPQISPDGKKVIYTRRWTDQQTDSYSGAVWIVDIDGSGNRFLLEGGNARWSPSGDRILYIANDAHGKPQLFVRWMTGEPSVTQITRLSSRPYSPKWSPDGKRIAFVAVVPAKESWNIEMPSPPEGAKWVETPRVVERLHYRQDRVGLTDRGFTHLFVVPADSGTARQLTSGEWNVGARFEQLFFGAGLSWSADSQSIVFDGLKDEGHDLIYRDSHIYKIDVETKELTQLTQERGRWLGPVVSPNGETIAFSGHSYSEMSYVMPRVYLMNFDGSEIRQIATELDRPAGNLFWSNSRSLYFSVQDVGYVQIYRAGTNGEAEALTTGQFIYALGSVNGRAGVGVAVASSAHNPSNVVKVSLSGRGAPTPLTDLNSDLLTNKTLGEVEEIWFEAEDGNRAHGWIVKPPGFDASKKYPLIMEIHGGPFAMYNGGFSYFFQALAAPGNVVLYTNPRGSTGYGEAFTQAIDHAYPSVDYLDLIGAVDAVVAQGYVDEDQMYVGGCSGGGKLSSWVIAHTNRFAAAAVRCPVSNWLSFAGTADIPLFGNSFFKKPFWEDPEKWLHHSSLMHIGKVETPTVVMTGVLDERTPMSQSEEYYAALKMRGIPSRLVRFNSEYHGTASRPSNAIRTVLYMLDWYGQHKRSDRD